MTDMLVKLYDLPPLEGLLSEQAQNGVLIRKALAPEKHHILAWVDKHFSPFWVSECDVAINNKPISCFVAIDGDTLIGFGCYDTTARGFFGPTGVSEQARGRGIGKVLLLACLHDMRSVGYGYGIIGAVGPIDFYANAVGATVIPDSTPSVYRGLLRKSE
jgi:GNAT superfamily N-acetyltransferase